MRRHHDLSEISRKKSVGFEEEQRFPMTILLLSVVVLTVLFYQLAIEVPQDLGGRERGNGLAEMLTAGIEGTALGVASQPIVSFAAFMALLAPGLIFYRQSRRYFQSMIICTILVSCASFVLTKQPAQRLGEAIHQISTERELPR